MPLQWGMFFYGAVLMFITCKFSFLQVENNGVALAMLSIKNIQKSFKANVTVPLRLRGLKTPVENARKYLEHGQVIDTSQLFRKPSQLAEFKKTLEQHIQAGESPLHHLHVGIANGEEVISTALVAQHSAKKYGLRLIDVLETDVLDLKDRRFINPDFFSGVVSKHTIDGVELNDAVPPRVHPALNKLDSLKQWLSSFDKEAYWINDDVSKFRLKSIVKAETDVRRLMNLLTRVPLNQEVQAFVQKTLDSPAHAYLGVDVSKETSKVQHLYGTYDTVMCNNVWQYLDKDAENQLPKTLKDLAKPKTGKVFTDCE
jgi:hypothetical protein